MAVQDQLWHDISWEEKRYFKNTSSTSYGQPVKALYRTDENGKPCANDLTEAGKKYFGVDDDDIEASYDRAKLKESSDDDCCCSLCSCIYKIICCFL